MTTCLSHRFYKDDKWWWQSSINGSDPLLYRLLQMRCHTLWQTGTVSSTVEWTCQGHCNNCHLYQGSIMHTVQMCCSYRHKSKAPFIYFINSYCTLWLSIAFASIKYAKAPTLMSIVEMSCDNWHVKRFRIILTVARVQH